VFYQYYFKKDNEMKKKYNVIDEYGRIVEENIELTRAKRTVQLDCLLRIVKNTKTYKKRGKYDSALNPPTLGMANR